MIVMTGMVGIRIKPPSNFKPQVSIIFELCLNHIYPLLGQIEDAIINTIFVIFILFLFIILFIDKEKILRKIIQIIIVMTGMVGIGTKKIFLILNLRFLLYLNYV